MLCSSNREGSDPSKKVGISNVAFTRKSSFLLCTAEGILTSRTSLHLLLVAGVAGVLPVARWLQLATFKPGIHSLFSHVQLQNSA